MNAGAVLSETPFTPIESSLVRLRSLVSPHAGIVRRVDTLLAGPDEPRRALAVTDIADYTPLTGAVASRTTAGSGLLAEQAEAAAIGEAAERYSATYVDERALVLASAEELGESVVGPRAFPLFSEAQYAEPDFPYARFTERTRIKWARGFSLPDGECVYLPAQLVYLHPAALLRHEPPIAYATSNGMACGPTLAEAVLAGLLEVLERDAVMIAWYARLRLPLLHWADDRELASLVRRVFAPTRVSYRLIEASGIWKVPTVLGVARAAEQSRDPVAFVMSAATGPTVQRAALKALLDLFRTRSSARRELAAGARPPDTPDAVGDFRDHMLFYTDAGNAADTAFLDGSDRSRSTTDVAPLSDATPATMIDALLDRLRVSRARTYCVDITAPDIRAAGLHVVKVICPSLCTIDVGYRFRFLGNPRLRTAPYEVGLSERVLEPDELNQLPHPFP